MKRYLPHVIAVAFFLVLTIIYFLPLLDGKELKQDDISRWKGMAQEIVEFNKKTGEHSYWTNSMFGGMPGYQISAVYAANLIQYVDKVLTLGLPTPANFVFLLLAGFYFLLITLKVDRHLAIAGAIAFAFSSYFLIIIDAGHNSKAHALGYMAPVIAGIIMTYRGRFIAGAAIAGLSLALQLHANHLQITYYLMLMTCFLIAAEFYSAVIEKRLGGFFKASALLGFAAVLAVLSNITNLWATQEYGKYSTRGPSELKADKENQTSGLDRDYITDWSYGIGESLTLLVPDFKGGASEPIGVNNKDALEKVDRNFRQNVSGFGAYFGDQPFVSGPQYVGAIVLLLFVLGLFVIKGPMKWWLMGATILSLLLSWGRNFMDFTNFFLDTVPGYDKFRAVSMILIIAQFTIPLLAVITVDKMIRENDFFSKYKSTLKYVIGAVLGITLLIAVTPGMFTEFYTQEEFDKVASQVQDQQNSQALLDNFFQEVSVAREQIVKSDALRSLFFLLAAAALIWTFLSKRYNSRYFVYGLMFLIAIDLLVIDRRYLSSDDFVKKSVNTVPFPMTAADQYIKQDTTQSYRVLNLTVNIFNDASTSYYHQSIGGYHGAKLKKYKELIDYSLTPEVTAISGALQRRDPLSIQTAYAQPAVNMLNTKYIIYNPDAPPLINTGALGNAWYVSSLKYVADADSEIAAIRNFNPETTAIVDRRYSKQLEGFNFNYDSTATITLLEYKPNHLVYSTSSNSEQLAVFSEIYYDKGWNAYVDGKAAEYFRVNYVLRGMRVPAGSHSIEWKFEPQSVETGEKIAFAGSLILLLLCGLAAVLEYKGNRNHSALGRRD